jgi:hypothetical protein
MIVMSTSSSAPTLAQFEGQLEALRLKEKLARVTDELEGMPISALPDGVYGYSYSQPSDEMPLFAKRQYQCYEWHKRHDGVITVVGYAKPADAAAIEARTEPVDFNLYPEPYGEATTLLILDGKRIRRAKAPSRSDGNYMFLQTEVAGV